MKVGEIVKEELAVAAENLKAEGLDIAEEVLTKVMLELNATVKRVVVRTENKIDDMYLIVEGQITETLSGLIDKVDGEVG